MGSAAQSTFNPKRKMKILYISTRIDGSGGLQRSLSVRLNYLAQNGYDINLLTTNSENDVVYFPLDKKIKHTDVKNVSSFFRYRKLIQATYKKTNPDLVVVVDNGLKGFLVPYFLPNTAKIIFELHATKHLIIQESHSVFRHLGIAKNLLKNAAKKFDAFVFLSEIEAALWKLKNQVVLANPLSFSTTTKSNLDHKKVIFVGRQSLLKGIDLLLEVWQEVNKTHPDWKLEVYGQQLAEFDTQKEVDKRSLTDSVTIYKPVTTISEKYASSSILLMTSRTETFGLVLTEAMSCGLPCIAFDAPTGPSSIIENNKNGFLIPCFDIELFAKKVIELIENESLRKEMGQHAQKSVEKFELEKIMHQWEFVFEKLTYNEQR